MTDYSNLSVEDDVAPEKDTLPAERSFSIDSGVYPVTIDLAYLVESKGGSTMLNIHFKEDPFGGFTVKERLILTSGHAKGKKNTYTDSDGVKHLLPGMSHADSIAKLTCGKGFGQLMPSVEKKMVKLWNFDAKAEIPTEVDVVMDLMGKKLQVGILKVEENKRRNEGGNWVDTNEKKDKNELDRVFNEDGQTAIEATAGQPGTFLEKWKGKNDGRTVNRYKPVPGAATPTPGAPAAPAPTTDGPLFS